MKAIVFPDRASFDAYSAKVDAALGYPKAGVDVGGGVHALPSQSVTQRWADPIEHPTQKGTFAYCVDGLDTTKLAKSESDQAATAQVLTADWTPAPVQLVATPETP